MAMKGFNDLARDQHSEVEPTAVDRAPLRSGTRPQGRPSRGKAAIKSRTMSIEDEYMSLIDTMTSVSRWNRMTRSDVIRAAVIHLSRLDPKEMAETILKLKDTPASDASIRSEEIKRILE